MQGYKLVVAEAKDQQTLTEIAFQAKRYWEYPEEWIQLWTEDLTISSVYISSNYVFKVIEVATGNIVGFCGMEHHRDTNTLEIAHAWLLPSHIGNHIGSWMVSQAMQNLQTLPVSRFTVVADPNAAGFYEKLGFIVTHTIASKPLGRFLPVLEMTR